MKPSLYKYRKLQNLAGTQSQAPDLANLSKQPSLSIGKAPTISKHDIRVQEARKQSLYTRGSQRKPANATKQQDGADIKVLEDNLEANHPHMESLLHEKSQPSQANPYIGMAEVSLSGQTQELMQMTAEGALSNEEKGGYSPQKSQ